MISFTTAKGTFHIDYKKNLCLDKGHIIVDGIDVTSKYKALAEAMHTEKIPVNAN